MPVRSVPEGDQRQRPEPDRVVEIVIDAAPSPSKVDFQRPLPELDAGPPDDNSGEIEKHKESAADPVGHATLHAGHQSDMQFAHET